MAINQFTDGELLSAPRMNQMVDQLNTRYYVVDQAAGRTVKVWDYLNQREQLIYGDTGIRDITSLASVPIKGSIELSRSGSMVLLRFDSVATLGESLVNLLYLPVGFRAHKTTNYWLSSGASSNAADRSLQLYGSGNTRINGADVGDDYRQSFAFRTKEPWPTTLPGVAA